MQIRTAIAQDVPIIYAFIQKKAAFDRHIGAFSSSLKVTPAKLHKTLFGSVPFSHVLFAEIESKVIGFALYGFRYSSFIGQPSIWLDDTWLTFS